MEATDLIPRYSRQMIVPAMGGLEGQRKLTSCSVLVVGAGGIGSTVLMYLAGAGIGRIEVLDFDVVEVSNLHRQVLHDTAAQGRLKCDSAVERLSAINPAIQCTKLHLKLTTDNALSCFQDFDIIVDATDNFEARYIINDACVLLGKPLISGSAVGLEGQITVYAPRVGPCYRCVYPSISLLESCRSCANAGVLGPVPGLIGCMQAMETIKVILSAEDVIGKVKQACKDHRQQHTVCTSNAISSGDSSVNSSSSSSGSSSVKSDLVGSGLQALVGRQVFYDAASGEFHNFKLPPRNRHCAVCGEEPSIRSMADCQAFISAVATPSPSRPSCNPAGTCDATPASVAHISATSYYDNVCRKGVRHVLLDVRSAVQFAMVSLEWYRQSDASRSGILAEGGSEGGLEGGSGGGSDTRSRSYLIDAVNGTACVVPAPLAELRGVVASAGTNDPSGALVAWLNSKLRDDLAIPTASVNTSSTSASSSTSTSSSTSANNESVEVPSTLPVYVLCRRGIDSVTATQLLADHGIHNVHNVEGGLTAWHAAVDQHFPIY